MERLRGQEKEGEGVEEGRNTDKERRQGDRSYTRVKDATRSNE